MADLGDDDGLYSMSRHHRQVLNQCRTFLIRNLEVKPIIDEFVTLGLISDHQEESLMVHKTNTELVRNFCNALMRLGPTAFHSFLDALEATNQGHIKEYIATRDVEGNLNPTSYYHNPVQNPVLSAAEEQGDAAVKTHRPAGKTVIDMTVPSKPIDPKASLDMYRMRGGQFVNVLIINNELFLCTSLEERMGSARDIENLEQLFCMDLKCNVRVEKDLTAADMRKTLRLFSQEESQANADACIVVIMSHGDNGLVYGTDKNRISVRDTMELFGAEQCKHLIEKPKYFIFQSCRGVDKEIGVDTTDTASTPGAVSSIERYPLELETVPQPSYIPTMVDTLVSYATLPGYVSWRNSEKGSWFIQAFCKVFRENAANNDVRRMQDMVTNELVERYGKDYVQLCEHTSRLRRLFYLTPQGT